MNPNANNEMANAKEHGKRFDEAWKPLFLKLQISGIVLATLRI